MSARTFRALDPYSTVAIDVATRGRATRGHRVPVVRAPRATHSFMDPPTIRWWVSLRGSRPGGASR